ncbi:D-lactate dehydrogenase (cytochrome) 2 [Perkinsela sp. CCAP 1560/4]|nr:D-lactate dehydrogenase (cytochrome) 2 [Perkinsela sp. CCAP 1560/4]|eukprot:KNH04835.1 D-lactate dehydrogenase (cytochrome) 2 [Perkinsela sp. CCAP 1560/4]
MHIDSQFGEDDRSRKLCQIQRADYISAKRDNFGQILMVDLHSVQNLFKVADERVCTSQPLIPPNCFVYLFTNGDTILHRAIERQRSYFALLQRQNVEIDITPNIRDDAHIVGMTQAIGEYSESLPLHVPFTILSPEDVFDEIIMRLSDYRDISHVKALPPTKMANKSLNDRSWADPLKKRLWENAHLPILKSQQL